MTMYEYYAIFTIVLVFFIHHKKISTMYKLLCLQKKGIFLTKNEI